MILFIVAEFLEYECSHSEAASRVYGGRARPKLSRCGRTDERVAFGAHHCDPRPRSGTRVDPSPETTRSVQVAPQAAAFLLITERLLHDLDRSIEDVKGLATGTTGSVVVGGSASFLAFAVAPAIGVMARQYPGVSIRLFEDLTETLSERLLTGEVDFGFASVWQDIQGVESTLLMSDRIGVLCSPERKELCRTSKLRWRDIAKEPMVALPRTSGMRGMFRRSPFAPPNIEKPNYEVASNLALLDLVERDVGIALIPALSAKHQESARRVFKLLVEPVVWRRLCLVQSCTEHLDTRRDHPVAPHPQWSPPAPSRQEHQASRARYSRLASSA